MWKLTLTIFACTLLLVDASARTKRQVTHEFKNKNYYAETLIKANFHNAVMFCQRLGMQLLTIGSNEEYDYLLNIIKTEFNFDEDSKLWTSGNDLGQDRKWHWLSTGFPIKIKKWLPDEPNGPGHDEHCVAFWNNKGNIGLNDDRCWREAPFICESFKS